MILNMTITGTSSTKSIMIISIDSGSTVVVYSDAACTTKVKDAIEKNAGEFWVTDLINRTYYIKATKSTDERIIPYTITEYGVYRISMSYSSIPAFTYMSDGVEGEYEIVQDDDTVITDVASWRGNWKIRFLTSGTLNFTQVNGAEDGIDVFLVGGGGGSGNKSISGGGGGGYTASHGNISVSTGIDYEIVVGEGGIKNATSSTNESIGGAGGASSAFGKSVEGGKGGASYTSDSQSRATKGGDGGSGGAGSYWNKTYNGGSDGGDGAADNAARKGLGQGTSTREFYSLDLDTTAKLYSGGGGNHANDRWGVGGAGGGGGNGTAGSNGADNLGGGASGFGYNGGTGIVIIRNTRS